MTKTQYFTTTSIDGFIADEHHSLEWLRQAPRGADQFGPFFAGVGAFAMGANSYRWVLEHENLLDQPRKWRTWYGEVPCWVFTHHALPLVADASITFVNGDVRPVHEARSAPHEARTYGSPGAATWWEPSPTTGFSTR